MENTENFDNFGYRVERLLKDQNLTSNDLCDAVGIIRQSYYDWRRRDSIPNCYTAYKVAKFLGVSVEYLLTGDTTIASDLKVIELQKQLNEIRDCVLKNT